MLKLTNRTFALLALFASIGTVGASFVGHASDPADDFSFTLSSHAPRSFALMSEKRVAEVFQDRLDLFPRAESVKLSRHLVSLCRQYRFDPAFVLALIQVESSFKIKARSPVGAVGLMQLMPATAQVVARSLKLRVTERALLDLYMNLSLGVAYLAYLRDHYAGLPAYYIVGAYNVGPAKMDELRARKGFRPVATKKYYEAIRQGLPEFRSYRRPASLKSAFSAT
jgi:hypothetical protein